MDTPEMMVDFQAMEAALRAPFHAESVEWRPVGAPGTTGAGQSGKQAQLPPSVDAGTAHPSVAA